MPSLCSTECARTSLRVPSGMNFGTRNSEMPLVPARRIGQPRQHEVDDVVGQVVLAIGDEDLRAGDAVAAVARALGLGAQRADVGAGLRLGELHGAHPFAADELGEIALLELVGAVGGERIDRRHGQHRADAEGHRGRIPHLDAGGVDARAAAPGRPIRPGAASPFQPAAAQARVGLLPARRRGDDAVLERRAELVADGIERRDHVGGELAGLLQHGIDGRLVEIAVKPLAPARPRSRRRA